MLIVKFLRICKSLRLLFEYGTICAKLFILLYFFLHNSKIICTFVVKYFTLNILTIDDPKVAQAKLLRWIKKDKQFHQSLVGMGLSSHDKDYSPEQVRAMVEKFGAPGEYEV